MTDSLSLPPQGESWIKALALPPNCSSFPLQLWLVPLRRPAGHVEQLRALLSTEEIERASRFALPELQTSYIVGRAALRLLLGSALEIEAADIQLSYAPKGKPFLANPPSGHALSFNLAHSGEFALIGLSIGPDLGVDLEWVRERPDLLEIAARFFAPAEHASLASASGPEQLTRFYRLWTRKEALLKALGHGIAGGLREPDLSAGLEDGSADLDASVGNTRWWIHELTPVPGYQGAVALRRAG